MTSGAVSSVRWFVAGGVLSVVSALVLAWSGTVCVDVIQVLFARNVSELTALGQRLGRVSWCPLGIAVGTTLIAGGFRRSMLRGRLSQRSLGLVALYGLLAACGAYFLFEGTSLARHALLVVATSEQPIQAEELRAVVSRTTTAVSRGWMLFAVAQVLLVIGGLMQSADQSKPSSEARPWPKIANMALSLLWVFGAVATIAWLRRSGEILQLRVNEPIKASLIAEMLNGVLSMSWFASLFLLGHAALTTIVAVAAYRKLSRLRATGIQNH
ncbi:MAG: hypothetical protein ACKV2Q_26600 [Planctomycetaceae bacterium]